MKPPLIGSGIGHGGLITARQAENVWFEPRPEGEKASVIAKALPRLQSMLVSSDLRMLASMDDDMFMLAIDGTGVHLINVVENPITKLRSSPVTTIPYLNSYSRFIEPRAVGGHDGWLITSGHDQYTSIDQGGLSGLMHDMPSSLIAVSCTYHRGYYLIAAQNRIMWVTDLSQAPAALNYTGADASRDSLVELVDIGTAVAAFGQRSIEFFGVTSNPDQPFQPIVEASQKIGVMYNRQVKAIGNTVYFWGNPERGTPGLFQLQGLNYSRVSTEDIERAVMDAQHNNGAVSLDGWMLNGHPIIKLTALLSSGEKTLLFDAATGATTTITPGAPFHGRSWTCSAGGNLIFGNPKGIGVIRMHEVDLAVPRSLTTDHVTSEMMDRFTVDNVRVDVTDMPAIGLEYSKDGGATWIGLGEANGSNATTRRAQWNRLGIGREFTFRLSSTGKFQVANMMLNARN